MEQTRKYMLVDPEAVARFGRAQQQQQQPTQHESAMDRDMQAVLESKADDYEKWMRYRQTLQRYLQFQSEQRKPIALDLGPADPEPLPSFDHVLQTVPKAMRAKTELLAKYMFGEGIKWNERGELVADGESVANTNYIDLINDVSRKRQHIRPRGRERLRELISKLNIPQEWIGNSYYHQEAGRE